MTTPGALDRLWISIRGIASRTVSRVSDLIASMKATGAGDEAIKKRLLDEAEQGTILSEMRNFAASRAPGFVGDMIFRFARDTLADRQSRAKDAYDKVKQDRIESSQKKILDSAGVEKTRLQQIQDAYIKQGIDTTAYQDELPEPPPDADLEDEYMWVAVVDNNTCAVCAGNHGDIKTLGEWSAIGEPRSGACYGEQNCRCILVPETVLSKSEKSDIRSMGPLLIEK
jgi:hypothetical protein